MQGSSDPNEILTPTAVSQDSANGEYIVKRFVDTANSVFGLTVSLIQAITNHDPDVAAIAGLYEDRATDIGYIKMDGSIAAAQKTNITREIAKIRTAMGLYDDNDPCPDDEDQDAIYDLFNSVIQVRSRVKRSLARKKIEHD